MRVQNRYLIRAACFAASVWTAFAFQTGAPAAANPARELVTKYCVSCHNEKVKTAGLVLDRADANAPWNSLTGARQSR